MLWIPQDRKTRSGAVFSPFWPLTAQTLVSRDFDFEPLLRQAVAREVDAGDDVEDFPSEAADPDASDDLDGIDDSNPATFRPSPSPSPSPPRKRVKREVKLEDIPKRNHHRHAKRRDQRNAAIHARGQRVLPSTLDASSLPSAHGAYAAKIEDAQSKYGSKKRRSLTELTALGFRVIQWDGIEARPIVDSQGRIIAVLAGRPRDPAYAQAVSRAFQAMCLACTGTAFPASMARHRRGLYPTLIAGLSYSKGQRVPSRLDGGEYAVILSALLGNLDVRRMAIFASAAFGLWAPKVYQYYKDHDDALHKKLSHLGRNFDKSVFSCAAFNFGPNACTFKHRDILNVPFGWCAVTAMGNFDPCAGGHLVLWDLKLVVEFPHAATILLPSATIAHSNIPFTPGGLIRYVDNGFRTEGKLQEDDPEEYLRLSALKETRWSMGIGLLSTVDELLQPVNT
ncbi:hypothetical protein DFH09DRAFT_1321937 [Mycena vulgaris]|nr:hypothetical protein DFH09DRAFT_1321937 [Mycena vulgaris]